MSQNDHNPDKLDIPSLATIAAALKPQLMSDDHKSRLKSSLMKRIKQPGEDLFIVRAQSDEWREFAPGVETKTLHRDPATEAETTLWRLAPGTVVPEHSHSLDEELMVLEGKLRIGPEELGPGDYLLGKKGIDHPEITTAEGALLLIRSESQTSEL